MADNDDDIVDDLDFSDLDLGSSEEALDEPAAERKKGPDLVTLAIYGLIGVSVIGVVVWQMGLLGGKKAGGPTPTEQTAAATDPAQQPSDPFNVMGTPAEAPDMPLDSAAPNAAPTDPNAPPAQAMQMDTAQGGVPAMPAPTPADGAVTAVMPAGEAASAIPTDTVPMPEQVPAGVSPTPAAADPASLAAPNGIDDALGAATPSPTDAMPGAAPIPAVAAPTAPVTTPAPEVAPATMMAAPAAAPAAAPIPTPVATKTEETTVSGADMNAILDRLEAIEKRLDAKENNNSASPAIASELQSLKNKVAELESGTSSRSQEVAPAPSKAPAPKKKKSSTKKKSSSSKKSTSSKAADAPYNGGAVLGGGASSAASISSAPVSSNYTLRSAQPDTAWVSDGNGSLMEVRVGDMVPGIGQVRSISESGGTWSVNGTNGRISQ